MTVPKSMKFFRKSLVRLNGSQKYPGALQAMVLGDQRAVHDIGSRI